MVSTETGQEVEWAEETNYHFKLSAMRENLLEFYAKTQTSLSLPRATRLLLKRLRRDCQT